MAAWTPTSSAPTNPGPRVTAIASTVLGSGETLASALVVSGDQAVNVRVYRYTATYAEILPNYPVGTTVSVTQVEGEPIQPMVNGRSNGRSR